MSQKSSVRDRIYWLRLLRFFVINLGLAILGLPVLVGSLSMLLLLYVPCQAHQQTPADYGHDWEDVTIPAKVGGSFRGYFIPGSNGAAIIMPAPYAGGRDSRLDYADLLVRHGYSVLTIESRRCADMGPTSLGYKEVNEVADALDYLLARPDVEPDKIGIQGFSSAGATAVMAAARLPRLRAVVAEGGYGDFDQNTLGRARGRGFVGYFERLHRWSTRLTFRLVTGISIKRLSPLDVIDEIAPRPILLVYGSRENSLTGGRQQLAAAGDNAELWVVEGAVHGNYLEMAPQEYERRIVGFFDRALGK